MRINNQSYTTSGGSNRELEPFIELNNHLEVSLSLFDKVKYKFL